MGMRRPFIRTSVRGEPRPRRFTLPEPSEPWARASNWLVSPSTPLLTGKAFISSRTVGEPSRLSCSALSTATGKAASVGVPLMKDPVTTISSILSAAGLGASAAMAVVAVAAIERAVPSIAPLHISMRLFIISLLVRSSISECSKIRYFECRSTSSLCTTEMSYCGRLPHPEILCERRLEN